MPLGDRDETSPRDEEGQVEQDFPNTVEDVEVDFDDDNDNDHDSAVAILESMSGDEHDHVPPSSVVDCDATPPDSGSDDDERADVRKATPKRHNSSSKVTFSPRTSSKSLSASSRKLSKLSSSDLASLREEDAAKSHAELLELTSDLRDKVARYKVDWSAEKALRKKKEKNLMKLAKELTSRSLECKEKGREIEELLSSHAALDTKLSTARSDLSNYTLRTESEARSRHRRSPPSSPNCDRYEWRPTRGRRHRRRRTRRSAKNCDAMR